MSKDVPMMTKQGLKHLQSTAESIHLSLEKKQNIPPIRPMSSAEKLQTGAIIEKVKFKSGDVVRRAIIFGSTYAKLNGLCKEVSLSRNPEETDASIHYLAHKLREIASWNPKAAFTVTRSLEMIEGAKAHTIHIEEPHGYTATLLVGRQRRYLEYRAYASGREQTQTVGHYKDHSSFATGLTESVLFLARSILEYQPVKDRF